MRYLSKEVLLEMLEFIRQQAEFIVETTADVKDINTFLINQSGMILYNSTCMCLQTIGETVKKINDLSGKSFFAVFYP